MYVGPGFLPGSTFSVSEFLCIITQGSKKGRGHHNSVSGLFSFRHKIAWICFLGAPPYAMMFQLLCIYGSCSDFMLWFFW